MLIVCAVCRLGRQFVKTRLYRRSVQAQLPARCAHRSAAMDGLLELAICNKAAAPPGCEPLPFKDGGNPRPVNRFRPRDQMAVPAADGHIEIELAGGHRMRINGGYDPEALARLIRGLTQ